MNYVFAIILVVLITTVVSTVTLATKQGSYFAFAAGSAPILAGVIVIREILELAGVVVANSLTTTLTIFSLLAAITTLILLVLSVLKVTPEKTALTEGAHGR